MNKKVMLVLFLLLGVIGFSLCSSCFKEGFELATEWKQNGELSWDGPYSLPDTPGWLSNTSKCGKSSGCLCNTPAQLQFLSMS